jgi:hypothetical protein
MRTTHLLALMLATALACALPSPALAHTIELEVDSTLQCQATLIERTTSTPLTACYYDLPTNMPPTSATLRFQLRQGAWARDISFRLLAAYMTLETSHRLRYPAAPSSTALPAFISDYERGLRPFRNRTSLSWDEARTVWATLFWADRALSAQPALTNHPDDLRRLNKLVTDSCEHLLTATPSRTLIAPSIADQVFPYCNQTQNIATLSGDALWLAVPYLEQSLQGRSGLTNEYRVAAVNDTLSYYESLTQNENVQSNFARTPLSLNSLRERAQSVLLGASIEVPSQQHYQVSE